MDNKFASEGGVKRIFEIVKAKLLEKIPFPLEDGNPGDILVAGEDEDKTEWKSVSADSIVSSMFPIGFVLANANPNFNPNIAFPGTVWEEYAHGRILMGASRGRDYQQNTTRIYGDLNYTQPIGGVNSTSGNTYSQAEFGSHYHDVPYQETPSLVEAPRYHWKLRETRKAYYDPDNRTDEGMVMYP